MRNRLFISLLLLSAAIYSACGTDVVVSQPTGSLSCKINGVQWTCPKDADLIFKAWDSLAPIRIDASMVGGGEIELDFRSLKDIGIYLLKGNDSVFTKCIYSPSVKQYSGIKDASSFVAITQIDSNLKYFDPSKSPAGLKFINLKGTFGFICLNNYGDTVSITNGKFDLVCNPYPPLP
jgi:hypothetical protein